MAASKSQGSYLVLFWTAITVLCAGIAYITVGFGKLVLLIGLVGLVISLFGFLKIKPLEGKTAAPAQVAGMKLLGTLVTWLGWLVTVVGLHLVSSTGGRIIFALIGIAVSLVGIIGILPTAFGRSVAGKTQSSSFIAAKTTMEHSR
jgi:hypothetical protein